MENAGLIYKQIPKVMASVGAIGKDRKNPQQGYQFRGIDDIYNALNNALSEHEVFTVPKVLDIKREERATKSGGSLIYTILTVAYSFFAADGSSVESITIGEAMDSGDKSCNKAMSAAQKYAFLQVFSIPTEEPKDTENQSYQPLSEGNGNPRPAQSAQQHDIVYGTHNQGAEGGKYITASDAAGLEGLVEAAGMNKTVFLKTFKAESFATIPSDQLHAASAMLSKRKAA